MEEQIHDKMVSLYTDSQGDIFHCSSIEIMLKLTYTKREKSWN